MTRHLATYSVAYDTCMMIKTIKYTCKTYNRFKFLRSPKELGSSPLNLFPERSSVWRFHNFPIATGTWPENALFCNVLNKHNQRSTVSTQIAPWSYKKQSKSLVKYQKFNYIDCKLVRFPMAGDKIPDISWPGITLVIVKKKNQKIKYYHLKNIMWNEKKKKLTKQKQIHQCR